MHTTASVPAALLNKQEQVRGRPPDGCSANSSRRAQDACLWLPWPGERCCCSPAGLAGDGGGVMARATLDDERLCAGEAAVRLRRSGLPADDVRGGPGEEWGLGCA